MDACSQGSLSSKWYSLTRDSEDGHKRGRRKLPRGIFRAAGTPMLGTSHPGYGILRKLRVSNSLSRPKATTAFITISFFIATVVIPTLLINKRLGMVFLGGSVVLLAYLLMLRMFAKR
jgi:hypothetical protein